MNILIFLGPAGSGKGTQAQYLKAQFNFAHISTGDLLRAEVKSDSDLGKKVQAVMKSGNLVSDEIIIEIIKDHVTALTQQTHLKGIVFDGFPRTLAQGKAFDSMLNSLDLRLNKAMYFDLSLAESIKRISGRQIDSRNNNVYHKDSNPAPADAEAYLISRNDDQPEKVKHRYDVYQKETEPLISHYNNHLVRIDCNQSIDDINAIFNGLIQSFQVSA